MTDISLPYDQVCEIIQDAANEHAPDMPQRQAYMSMTGIFEWFSHALLRALEEAHFARQKEVVDNCNKV